jgi:hypothetical protein
MEKGNETRDDAADAYDERTCRRGLRRGIETKPCARPELIILAAPSQPGCDGDARTMNIYLCYGQRRR